MTRERWQQVCDLLEQALEVAPQQRPAVLDRACGSDPSLRQEVEVLLASSDHVRSSFLQGSPLVEQTSQIESSTYVLTAGAKLGPYLIQSLIGAGGMGEVYRARDTELKREVAIKVLPEFWSRDSERLHRFELEAQAAAALNHPNIVAIHHVGQHDGSPYIVTELLQGDNLRERLRKGPLRLREALDLGVEITRGLGAAHDAGIVHRDLKPENIFLTKDGRIKILDFGLAKLGVGKAVSAGGSTVPVEQPTSPGCVLGTVGYMSPEQVRAHFTDARSDIFAVGVILYEMLTGKPAFQKPTSAETMTAILNEDPPPISQTNATVPPALERIVNRCMAKSPEQRFQHASDLAFALEAQSDSSRPAVAGIQPAASSLAKFASRKKWILAAIALVPLAFGLGWWAWVNRPAEKGEMVQRQLTAGTGGNPIRGATISRDGKYLAYADKDGIWIQEIESGNPHKLAGTIGDGVVDWYPDSLRLLVEDIDGNLSTFFTITGEKRRLASPAAVPRLSPDGSQIAFYRELVPRKLWTMPSGGGEPQLLLTLAEGEQFTSTPAWSPDGKAIAYVCRRKSGAVVLEIKGLKDSASRSFLTDAGLIIGPWNSLVWLPDGRIVFELHKSGSPSDNDLWTLSTSSRGATAGKPVRLTTNSGYHIGGLSASSDGKLLAATFQRVLSSVFVADLNKGNDKVDHLSRLTEDSWNNWPSSWAADSQTLYYVSVRNHLSVYKCRIADDSCGLVLEGSENYFMWTPTPDGRWFIVLADGTMWGKPRLMRVPVTGGTPETILAPAGPAEVRCSVNGSRICVLSEQIGKQKSFSLVDPVRGRIKELKRIDMEKTLKWSLSADGSKIAMVEDLSDSVQVLDLESNQISLIRPTPPQRGLLEPAWSADGKRIFLTAFSNNGKGKLLGMDADGEVHLLLENAGIPVSNPVPSPDGKRISFVNLTVESNVRLLEKF